jgi:hypothetical protein
MTDKQKIKTSKFISLILRHNPSAAGVSMDPQGWVNVSSLLVGLRQAGYPTTLTELEEIVAEDNKQRYSFNKFKSHIRANQGHSIPVNLGLEPTVPPKELFHGIGVKYIDNIFKEGIKLDYTALRNQLKELAYLSPGMVFELEFEDKPKETITSSNGIRDYIKDLNGNKNVITSTFYTEAL